MPKIYELFGFDVNDKSENAERIRKSTMCPFALDKCDGGGYRNQTKIKLTDSDTELRNYFDEGISTVIPGICSILAGSDIWVVCPRRLFAARNTSNNIPVVNRGLQSYEREILLQTELPRSRDVGVWSEVFVKQQVEDAEINYHFDYVVAPLINSSLRMFLRNFGLIGEGLDREINNFAKHMKKKGYYSRGRGDISDTVVRLPDLRKPYIFEVMTASTSGSDTESETDIRNAFRNAILGRDHESPSINKRQVWGRMITQLFAKTALANTWAGQTLWIVQDELLRNIELTTLLKTSKIAKKEGSDINLVVMSYKERQIGSNSIAIKEAITGDSGLEFDGDGTFTDILLPKINPPKIELARAMLRRSIEAIVNLQ